MKTAKEKSSTKTCSTKAPASKGGVPSVSESGEVVKFNETGMPQIDVWLEDETVWLTQTQMAQLFKSSRTNVLEHIQHIYEDEELEKEATCRNFRQVRQEGKRMVNRTITMYNLDMIISVGYRVNSKRGVKFRQWANKVLKEYLIKGYVINERIRKEQLGELRQLVQVASRAISNQKIANIAATLFLWFLNNNGILYLIPSISIPFKIL